ncbi:thap domain-containing 9 [Paramuricea clavata]|uniref:Thap domain-containing 9 n=1 Tax=Paramuricea clavata TaxID=317549 RepID=A0A7D9HFB1_PARCT|nr:thap domain-containing 9 [Paramuricea clavata]
MELLPLDMSKVVCDDDKLSEKQEGIKVTDDSSMINAELGSGIVTTSTREKRKHSEESDYIKEVPIPQKRACMGIKHDHTYSVSSHCRLKQKADNLLDKAKNLKRKLKTSHMKSNRIKRKVNSLTSVVSELKKEKLVSNDCASILETTFSEVPKELMKRLVTQKKKKNPGLPHPSVISSWYTAVDGEPGFTKEALTALKAKVLAGKRDGQEVLCALMLDEMSIRKHVQWDGKKYRGFVDLDTGIHDDSLPEATEALVFMAVSLNSNWKVPCGYFLVNGLTGEEKVNLTKDCLTKLHEVGVKVVSFTYDGPTTHQAMLKLLGARLSADNLQVYFPHPCDNNEKIYVFLDACHMIKLVRNTMSDWKVMKDSDGNTIDWKFIEELHKLQETECLRLANKLRSAHVDWKPQKMKVNLAAQTLSSSVADALEYTVKKSEGKQFQGTNQKDELSVREEVSK